MIGFIIGLFVGAVIGIFISAILSAGGGNDNDR